MLRDIYMLAEMPSIEEELGESGGSSSKSERDKSQNCSKMNVIDFGGVKVLELEGEEAKIPFASRKVSISFLMFGITIAEGRDRNITLETLPEPWFDQGCRESRTEHFVLIYQGGSGL